ncbi:ABC transporter substrate-binding protein [Phreatobacter aquaticus]|uniref:ABC transporter substrate-binding protein n=1 Tax=Phreatobacter aquaticus TaxID=2570229 RepID=A0A4D7QJ06_9HYPH|nr:ABC transporter substrate-binding protein [Phreatobacter aquaticus]QCK87650.1 ABC transporter substrate-binding protein [Phreatobacter aquaticus]
MAILLRHLSMIRAAFVLVLLMTGSASASGLLRVAMHADLRAIDPIWSTAYITRNHGYMIYDTLFAMDANGEIKPQMVDRYEVSPDGLTYTFTLRDGLLWHDGQPVTAEDCIASIKRWGSRDTLGQKAMSFVDAMTATGPSSFTITLKEKTGLLIYALGKPSSAVPFMMPKRVADTPATTQITEFIGSGPFMFRREEWKPGDRSVYVKFDRYRPRAEPASALAGGKVAHFDRIEWVVIADHQQAVNALLAGEIDLIENPSHDLLPLLSSDRTIKLWPSNPIGNQYSFRPNHLHKPFDNPKIRQALWYVFNQEDFLKAVIGDPAYYTACHSIFICPTRFASDAGMDGLLTSNIQRARQLLQEAGYDGTPITLLQSTDVALLANLAPVAKSLMEKAGFVVDLQAMDWSTLVSRLSRKDPPSAGGWHGYFTSWTAADVLDPAMSAWLNSRCERALVGWPCDPEMERLRDAFASETDPDRQKEWAAAVQRRAIEWTPMIPLGQWRSAMASRANITDVLRAPVTVLWNIRRQ